MESSFVDISTAPMTSESECFLSLRGSIIACELEDADILISQIASETETGVVLPNKI